MKTFVINMQKDVRRKKDMQIQLDQLNVDYEFFRGVNGKTIPKEELSKISDQTKLEEGKKKPLKELLGLIGCTYSHFLIYKKMIDEDIPMACILEDDVIISSKFNQQLAWLKNQIVDNEIVSLHTLLYDPVLFKSTDRTNDDCGLFVPTPPKIRGTQGYVITLHCAKQLMKEMMPIKEFPDCFNRYHLFCPDVQIRVLYPFILRHMWIDSVRDDKLKGWISCLMNIIQKYRIFPLWNLIRFRRKKINDKYIYNFISTDDDKSHNMYVKDIQKNSLISNF